MPHRHETRSRNPAREEQRPFREFGATSSPSPHPDLTRRQVSLQKNRWGSQRTERGSQDDGWKFPQGAQSRYRSDDGAARCSSRVQRRLPDAADPVGPRRLHRNSSGGPPDRFASQHQTDSPETTVPAGFELAHALEEESVQGAHTLKAFSHQYPFG